MRKLQQILSGETEFGELLARRSRELALEKRVQTALPAALAACVGVADARSEELVLLVSSGAAGALLRQRIPQLLAALASAGLKFTGIRVRVQARSAAQRERNSDSKQIDSASIRRLETLAAQLGDEPLSQALRRLARSGDPSRSDRSDRNDKPFESVKDEHGEQ
jgi:hypothetical protein